MHEDSYLTRIQIPYLYMNTYFSTFTARRLSIRKMLLYLLELIKPDKYEFWYSGDTYLILVFWPLGISKS